MSDSSDINSSGSFTDDDINISKANPKDFDLSNVNNDFVKFDPTKFNKDFEQKKKQASKIVPKKEIDEIEIDNVIVPLHQQSIIDILIGIKNTWFDILMETLTKKDRMFYIGITIIIVTTALFLYNYLTENEMANIVPEKIIEKHYIYGTPPENIIDSSIPKLDVH